MKLQSGCRLTVDLVDLGVGGQDLVGQFLGGGQHLGVMGCDQVLDQLLQLVSVHLEQRLRDGQPQLHLHRSNTEKTVSAFAASVTESWSMTRWGPAGGNALGRGLRWHGVRVTQRFPIRDT